MTLTASCLILWYMKACNFQGWTSLWGVIYIAPGYEQDQRQLRHERKHLDQMQRDGKLMYMVKYSYWLIKYGYLDNPYEIEARKAEFYLA